VRQSSHLIPCLLCATEVAREATVRLSAKPHPVTPAAHVHLLCLRQTLCAHASRTRTSDIANDSAALKAQHGFCAGMGHLRDTQYAILNSFHPNARKLIRLPPQSAMLPTQTPMTKSPRRDRRKSTHHGPSPSSSSCSYSPSSQATFCRPGRSRPYMRPSCLYSRVWSWAWYCD
jgi:hypothetical protein